ncbi:urea ABC transporter ATP-binding subunit UrtE [Cupriavidus plantarum]|uniref:Amino acid/amide ABC transporter ATP-binding protein 2 (HAAT family) n=1 Tax=Cupriavidus plantarum TaxID=942865 RepID=A0A316ENK1_9BURK|nr:urea ABC transporter ATP-binding subunit UrtE [Cupriavidus plantarum]NYI02352.1 urea transport system ATP-binding protein [Cupriavidus plantarum]PWK31557.1 amino acid/amide ABC transporter ATP-binding protein 2 (HAAT family) [Cupriavidus plantarum]REE85502.1 amino acid/amide ABC transporter ATP-binding protein 2 (HAAT family) [Cupriavidus plantarum]RLK28793.1 amino acid/amide ABC transporter ATP-binding protein 2 (HAAT family) [Cupriavidus plantarum]CAG2146020.1 High-affinity branched-chain
MLEVQRLNVAYRESHVIKDVSFAVAERESVAIMGRNGMGKTTLLKSLIGMLPARSGSIRLRGTELSGLRGHARVRQGLAFVPQGRMIFPALTVEQNILTGTEYSRYRAVPDYIYACFPVLRDMRNRRGGNLSGGQQQMLAIARALVSDPRVLILDEPTEGIQPSIIKDIARTLNTLRKERGFAIVVSEQMLSFALDLADRFLVIDGGRIVHEEARETLDQEKVRSFLTV